MMRSSSADNSTFTYAHEEAQLVARLTAEPSPSALHLRLDITTTSSAGVTLAEVAFPVVGGIRASSDSDQHRGSSPNNPGELVSGGGVRGTGLRVKNPGAHLSSPQLRWWEHGYAISSIYQDAYPHASTNWLALADTSAALYFGTHDNSLSLTSMRLSNASAACAPADGSFCVSLTANSSATIVAAGNQDQSSSWSRTVAIALVRDDSGRTPFACVGPLFTRPVYTVY